MGSLPSQTRPMIPPSTQNPSRCRVFVAFCPRDAGPNTNIFNCIQCYDPSNNTLTHVSMIPDILENHVLKGMAMVSVGESVYIIGGRLWDKGRPQNCSESADEFVDAGVEVSGLILRYDVRLDRWSKCAPLRTPRYDFAYSVCDNKIYVAGGKSNLAGGRGLSSAEVYDPLLDEWTPLPNMGTLRYKCVGVTWKGKIYVVGGFTSEQSQFSPQRSSAEVYDTRTGMWDFVPGMWQLDVPPNQIVAVNGKLFSSGDCLTPWKGHIEFYDEKLNMWDEVGGSCLQICTACVKGVDDGNYPPRPMERLYLTMAPIGTQLYFLACYKMAGESSRILSVVCAFDTSATVNAWKVLEPVEDDGEMELCSQCCVVQLS